MRKSTTVISSLAGSVALALTGQQDAAANLGTVRPIDRINSIRDSYLKAISDEMKIKIEIDNKQIAQTNFPNWLNWNNWANGWANF